MDIRQPSTVPPWLLLVFTLPAKRASQRVEVWRKLQRYGVVTLGNSGYLLPNNQSNQERFEWLATAVRDYGGNASVVEVQAIDNLSKSRLIRKFAEARAQDYREIIEELTKVASLSQRKGLGRRISRMRTRFQEVVSVDFFRVRCAQTLRGCSNSLKTLPRVLPRSPRAEKYASGITRKGFG